MSLLNFNNCKKSGKKNVKIFGGLGNQLFQFSFAIYLNKKFNSRVYLDINEFKYKKHHSGFKLSEIISVRFEFLSFYSHLKIKAFNFFNITQKKYYKQDENFINQIPPLGELIGNKYFEGYWQNLTMVNFIYDELRNSLKLFDDERIQVGSNFIAIHVRRGDYLLNEEMYAGICDDNYYINAMNFFKTKIKNPVFYVFSDDISWCKLNFNFRDNIVFVDFTNSAVEDFNLLVKFQNKIISNSTFSWWSAFLGNHIATVVAPKIWNNSIVYNDFIPNNWIKL